MSETDATPRAPRREVTIEQVARALYARMPDGQAPLTAGNEAEDGGVRWGDLSPTARQAWIDHARDILSARSTAIDDPATPSGSAGESHPATEADYLRAMLEVELGEDDMG